MMPGLDTRGRSALLERAQGAEVVEVVQAAETDRDRALVRALYIAGLRVTETVDLRTRDLITRDDGRGGQLAVFRKGSKTRPVLVPRSLFDELSTLALPDPAAPLFRSQKKGEGGELRAI